MALPGRLRSPPRWRAESVWSRCRSPRTRSRSTMRRRWGRPTSWWHWGGGGRGRVGGGGGGGGAAGGGVAQRLFVGAGLSDAAARKALATLMAGALENLRAAGPETALTAW